MLCQLREGLQSKLLLNDMSAADFSKWQSRIVAKLQSRSLKCYDNLTYLSVYAGILLSCGGAGEAYLLQSARVQCLLGGGRPLCFIAVG